MIKEVEIKRVMYLIERDVEEDTVDFKRQLDLKTDSQKDEFAKDVCALANTATKKAYLLVGVTDPDKRGPGNPAIIGMEFPHGSKRYKDWGAFQQAVQDTVERYCERPCPRVSIEKLEMENKLIGVIIISADYSHRPYTTRKHPGLVYIRKSTHTYEASPREIYDMQKDKINRDAALELSEEFLSNLEGYRKSSDVGSVLFPILSEKLKRTITEDRERHRYNYLMAKLYWVINDLFSSKKHIKKAIEDNQMIAAYWTHVGKVSCALAETELAQYDQQELSPGLHMQDTYKIPPELENAKRELAEAEEARDQALECRVSWDVHKELVETVENLQKQLESELLSIATYLLSQAQESHKAARTELELYIENQTAQDQDVDRPASTSEQTSPENMVRNQESLSTQDDQEMRTKKVLPTELENAKRELANARDALATALECQANPDDYKEIEKNIEEAQEILGYYINEFSARNTNE